MYITEFNKMMGKQNPLYVHNPQVVSFGGYTFKSCSKIEMVAKAIESDIIEIQNKPLTLKK